MADRRATRRATTGLTPDELEQRQQVDGSFDEDDEELLDEPLTPDMIEQRQVVEEDPDDAPRD